MNKQQWILAAILFLVGVFARAQTVEYIHTDALGSPVAVTNASGAVIERTVYEPYGAVINRPVTNGPGYTGHVIDAVTGLNYMQQRYYDPQLGRFLSNDPVTASSVGENFNRYWYADNNPYAYVDPDGRCTGSIIKKSDGSCPFAGRLITLGAAALAAADSGNNNSGGNAGKNAGNDDKTLVGKLKDHITPAPGVPMPPGASAASEKVKAAAAEAIQQAPILPPGLMWLRGMIIHNIFAQKVRALGPGFAAEVSYFYGDVKPYGFPGSVRADATYGPIAQPVFAFELKTGGAYVSVAERDSYVKHLPVGTQLVEIHERMR